MWTRRRWIAALAAGTVAAGAGAALTAGGAGAAPPARGVARAAAKVQIVETGSSLLYPLFQIWQAAYQSGHPAVQIVPQSTGSGEGIASAIQGLAQIGASDAYMADAQAHAYPNVLNLPLAVSAQQVMYNLPGVRVAHLNLSGPVLAAIYTGRIVYWDAPALRALNPHVALPHRAIVPVRRSDGSGDTFLFTQYLTDSAGAAWPAGFGTAVSWPPLPAEVAADGNQGVVQALKQTPGSIGYVGISWLEPALRAGLHYAALRNRAGRFVLPTAPAIQAAVQAMAARTPPDERISLVFAPGAASYPIVNFEYALVNRVQRSPAMAAALRGFLDWALDPAGGGQARYLERVHFVPLPPAVAARSRARIARIVG